MARYQQGIGTPETLGVQPTMWKEPKALNTPSLPIQKFNSGATRNYGGLKGGYLDTMQSRWWVGAPTQMPSGISKGLANRKFDQATAPARAQQLENTAKAETQQLANNTKAGDAFVSQYQQAYNPTG